MPEQSGIRVLTTVSGSGPMGERTPHANFYTVDELGLPPSLKLGPALQSSRTDIHLGDETLAFVIDNILTHEEAHGLIELSEQMGYSRFAPAISTPPGMRQNSAAHWFASEDVAACFLEPLMGRIKHLLPAAIAGTELYPHLSHRVAHYKYNDGDVFNRHTDGSWPGQAVNQTGNGITEWQGVESKLTMLLYLNDSEDGVQGGCTRLFPLTQGLKPCDVSPRTGSALFFRHGHGPDSVLHMGTQVHGDVPKYVVRLNVLYSIRDDITST